MDSSVDLNTLSATTGIDFQKLKAKYSVNNGGINEKGDIFKNVTGIGPSQAREKAERVQESYVRLNQYRTCDNCLGRGLVKSVYNFMVLESNCPKCDSEGVLKEAAAFLSGDHDDSPATATATARAHPLEVAIDGGRHEIESATVKNVGMPGMEHIVDQVDSAPDGAAKIVKTSASADSTQDPKVDIDSLVGSDTVD